MVVLGVHMAVRRGHIRYLKVSNISRMDHLKTTPNFRAPFCIFKEKKSTGIH